VIRRDLQRYYHGCALTLRRLALTPEDAQLLVAALEASDLPATSARFLWAVVEEYIRGTAEYPEGTQQRQAALTLVDKLRRISQLDAVAIVDAVEVYRDFHLHRGDVQQALVLSGLVPVEHVVEEILSGDPALEELAGRLVEGLRAQTPRRDSAR
jgi:hypothetical protein